MAGPNSHVTNDVSRQMKTTKISLTIDKAEKTASKSTLSKENQRGKKKKTLIFDIYKIDIFKIQELKLNCTIA